MNKELKKKYADMWPAQLKLEAEKHLRECHKAGFSPAESIQLFQMEHEELAYELKLNRIGLVNIWNSMMATTYDRQGGI